MSSKVLITVGIVLLYIVAIRLPSLRQPPESIISPRPSPVPYWSVRSIDTMKYSRDIAREKEDDSSFDEAIERQVADIAGTGASHVAIATPYDPEFVPFLTRWVDAAREHNLKVWFRGNASGWERWFGYKRISRDEHKQVILEFIKNNGSLFASGDIFTPCPECENGGEGDPRMVGGVEGYRQFLIDEYNASRDAFRSIGKNVEVGYYSMNFDVAKLVMDKPTTAALGGVVAIDHYVRSHDKLRRDLIEIAESSGGKIYLGEWGAPIPDIHGKISGDEQAAWINDALEVFKADKNVIGLNYWVNVGGSTEIWNSRGVATPAVPVITEYYSRLEIPQ
ncbi:hypothetical protein KBD69_04550 [Candidatus Woesebacteria bacterium]|nr:hypothetical protein [Candidatus Woesebacteria bacterium]